MKTKLSRRAALAGLALAPTAGLAATTTEVDPIFPLIERHRAAEAERTRLAHLMWAAYDRVPEPWRWKLPSVKVGLFVDATGRVRTDAQTHEQIDLCFEQKLYPLVHFASGGSNETPDAFRARLAQAHAALDREREKVERMHCEAGCRDAEAAMEVHDKVVEAAEEPLGAATATTWAGLLALVRYADELADEEVEETNCSAEDSMALYLLPAIKRSLVGLV
jgi:hypothetical protein